MALVLAAAPWSGPTVGGAPLSAGGGPVPTFAVPDGYHIVYRVTAPGIAPDIEELWVQRPFESFDRLSSGLTPGAEVFITTVARLGDQVVKSGGSTQAALIHVPPAPPSGDVRPDVAAAPALRSGRLLMLGSSTVAGRRCRVFRSAASLRTPGALAPLRAGTTYVDSCLDGDGLVLQETTYRSGKLAGTRTALSVQVGRAAGAGADYGMPATATAFRQGGGSFTPLTLSSSPPGGTSWKVTSLPAGFVQLGRYAVVPSQPEAFSAPDTGPPNALNLPGSLVTELDDVYVRGPDVIVVQQGQTMSPSRFSPPQGAAPEDLGATLGAGQLQLTGQGAVVSAEPEKGTKFVRVTGTLPPDQVLAVARSLRVEAPGTLVTIPPNR